MQLIKCVPARCNTSNHSHASYFLFLSHRFCLQEPVVFVSISKSRQETSDCSIHLSERHRIWCVNSEKNNCSVSNCLNKEACLGISQFPKLNVVADIFLSILNRVNLLKALLKLTWNSYTINTNTAWKIYIGKCISVLLFHVISCYSTIKFIMSVNKSCIELNFFQHLTTFYNILQIEHISLSSSIAYMENLSYFDSCIPNW